MQAMLLFRDDGNVKFPDDPEEGRALFQKFVDWAEDLEKRGKLVAVDPLERGGKTVRKRGGAVVVDGPFAEGREAVLGYYLVEVADFDEAVKLAEESPHTVLLGGATEVRVVGAFRKPARFTK
jgi:hypothetical protein